MDKTLRAFKLLMELREKAEDYIICKVVYERVGNEWMTIFWQTRYNNTRWKAGILERYIQERLKAQSHE